MRVTMIVLGALIAASDAARAEPGWSTYANPRFGVAADYPVIFTVRDPAPDNSDGQGFRTADGGATLAIFGRYNIDDSTPAQLMKTYKMEGASYSYAEATTKMFVLSGTKGGKIIYVRCNLGGTDIIGCVDVEYPAVDAAKWAPVVGRLSKSLRILPVSVK